jgi:hypothetical protein
MPAAMTAAEVVEETSTTEACADAMLYTVTKEPSDAVPGASLPRVIVALVPAVNAFNVMVAIKVWLAVRVVVKVAIVGPEDVLSVNDSVPVPAAAAVLIVAPATEKVYVPLSSPPASVTVISTTGFFAAVK